MTWAGSPFPAPRWRGPSPCPRAARLLHDSRWFHSLDKGFGGRAAFDPEGLAAELSRWLTAARFAPEVVRGRLETHRRQPLDARDRAGAATRAKDALGAALAIREGLHALTRHLMESWGGRDNSWARFGTRLERAAAERGAGELLAGVWALYGLSPGEVERRMAVAPEGVRHRHERSLPARRLVGEAVTAAQDARDVLLVFATREARYGQPPFAEWVGLETDPPIVRARLEEYGHLLEHLGLDRR